MGSSDDLTGGDLTDLELEAYLDEALPVSRTAEVESQLAGEPQLAERISLLNSRRDSGVHTLGQVWRRRRLTCPSRQQWGSYLLGLLPEATASYYKFHVETAGCRICEANLADLERQQSEAADHSDRRRRKYFQSSAGYLRS